MHCKNLLNHIHICTLKQSDEILLFILQRLPKAITNSLLLINKCIILSNNVSWTDDISRPPGAERDNMKKIWKYESLMTTPLKGPFSVMLKSHSQLRIPTGRRQTSWLCTKHGEFVPGITEDKFHSVVRVEDLNPGLSVFKSPTLTTEPRCLLGTKPLWEHWFTSKLDQYINQPAHKSQWLLDSFPFEQKTVQLSESTCWLNCK